MIYEVEIDVNIDSEYNAILHFESYEEVIPFVKTLLDNCYDVKIRGVSEDEE